LEKLGGYNAMTSTLKNRQKGCIFIPAVGQFMEVPSMLEALLLSVERDRESLHRVMVASC